VKQWHGALETLIMIIRIKFVYLVMIRSFYPLITRVEWSFVWRVGLSSLFFSFFLDYSSHLFVIQTIQSSLSTFSCSRDPWVYNRYILTPHTRVCVCSRHTFRYVGRETYAIWNRHQL
jgi:hypothetical protein